MKKTFKILGLILLVAAMLALMSLPAFADGETAADGAMGAKAIGAAMGGAIGMGLSVAKSTEGISRQPEAENKIRTTLMLGLVFVETAIIYALVIAILIIFVL